MGPVYEVGVFTDGSDTVAREKYLFTESEQAANFVNMLHELQESGGFDGISNVEISVIASDHAAVDMFWHRRQMELEGV